MKMTLKKKTEAKLTAVELKKKFTVLIYSYLKS